MQGQSPLRKSMTGCGCLLLVAVLALLFYVFTFGSTDAGPPVEQAVALIAGFYALIASAGRRPSRSLARS